MRRRLPSLLWIAAVVAVACLAAAASVSAFADVTSSPPVALTAPPPKPQAAPADSPVDLQMRGLAHHAKFNMILRTGGFAERGDARPLEALALGIEMTR